MSEGDTRVDRLLDAIELVKDDRREEARRVLRELIAEDGDSEAAWLWMSVAVDSLDQSVVCLDNVLRINPNNLGAQVALYRLRESHFVVERERSTLRTVRDTALTMLYLLVLLSMCGVLMWWVQ